MEEEKKELSTAPQALIQLTQIPVIEEHLRELKAEIVQSVEEAKKQACSPETLVAVRAVRTDLNKRKEALDGDLRKVRETYMAPWDKLRQTYKECVETPIAEGVTDLTQKIKETEKGIISQCEDACKLLFYELCSAENLCDPDGTCWLTYERGNFKIGLTEANQKTYKKAKDRVRAFVSGVAADVKAIQESPDAAEVMAEYKDTLCLSSAFSTVNTRHQRIAAEQAAREAQEARRLAASESVAKVEAAAQQSPMVEPGGGRVIPEPVPMPLSAAASIVAPVPAPGPAPFGAPQKEKLYRLEFHVTGTRDQLSDFKQMLIKYCEKEGLKL